MFFRLLLLFLITVFLAACSSVQKTGGIDQSQKTITMPPGAAMAPIKSALVRTGWTVRASNVTGATNSYGVTTNLGAQPTRYVMSISMEFFGHRFPDSARMYYYDISIIDTKTNEEVLIVDGTDTPNAIGKKLAEALGSP